MNDLKFALRQLLKSPGFTVLVVLTLALGIGANTAMFSVVNGVMLKPLEYPNSGRLVGVWERDARRGSDHQLVSPPNFRDWQGEQHVFEVIASYTEVGQYNLVMPAGLEKVECAYADSDVFTALQVLPCLGRTFVHEEDRYHGPRAAILSYDLWRRQFGQSSNVLGQTLTLDTFGRRDYTIVGVMPPGFSFPRRCELWLAAGWNGLPLDRRTGHWLSVLARLKPEVSLTQAATELSGLQRRIAEEHPEALIGNQVAVIRLLDQHVGHDVETALLVLWGIILGVLLIACSNVASLLIARGIARGKEFAVRAALGASRWRLARQLFCENLLLALSGGAFGTSVAFWTLKLFQVAGASFIPRLGSVRIDLSSLGFTIGLSLLTGVFFGVAPIWQVQRSNLEENLRGTSHASTSFH